MSIFGDGLSVRLSASTRDFERGVDTAQRSLGGLGASASSALGPLQALQGRADEAGDEIADVGRESSQTTRRLTVMSGAAGTTAGAFSALSVGTHGLGLSFGSLTSSLTTTLPLLAAVGAGATALLSTLVPLGAILGALTGGAFALAGAFSAIVGSGLIAFGKERGEQNRQRLEEIRDRIHVLEEVKEVEGELTNAQEEQLETLKEQADKLEDQTGILGGLTSAFADLREEIQPLIVEFGEQFVPLIEDAIDAIPALVENTIDAIGGFDTLVDALRAAGRTAFRVIPELAAGMFRLANRALPVAVDLFGWLLRNGGRIFQGMLRTTQQLAPVMMGFLDAVIEAAPEINKLGSRVLQVLVPAFSNFLGLIEDVVNLGESSDGLVGFIKGLVTGAIEWVKGPGLSAVGDLAGAFRTAFIELVDAETGGGSDTVAGAFIDLISAGINRVSEWLNAGGQQQISEMLITLFDSAANFVEGFEKERFRRTIAQPLMNVFARVFDAVTTALQSEQAGRLARGIGTAARGMMGVLADEMIEYARSDAFVADLAALGGAIFNSVGQALIGAFARRPGQPATTFQAGQMRAGHRGPRTVSQQLNDALANANFNITIEGDTGVIRDVTVDVIEERERRIDGLTGQTGF